MLQKIQKDETYGFIASSITACVIGSLFKGTSLRSNEKLNEELEYLGGEYNAYTDYDSTVYTISCLEEEIENGIKLLGDMMINSNFPVEEIEKKHYKVRIKSF